MIVRSRDLRNWHAVGWLVLLCVAAMLCAAQARAQTVTLAVEARSTDGSTVVPKLTWSTTPAATSCAASGDWSGSKATSGTETLANVSASKSYTLTCTWPGDTSCRLTWIPPTKNNNGTDYTNPGGFRIQYGRSQTELDQSVYLQQPTATTWTCPALAAGTWWFGVRTYNALGLESALTSPLVSKTLTASQSAARTVTVGFTVPGPPTGLTVQ